jgi:XTP/dITP diphosphohydrolase
MNNSSTLAAFSELIDIVKRLRKECPWDREQTHQSLTAPLLEETYEVIEAIESADMQELKKELGDVLLHVVFQSVLAEETTSFTLTEVINSESEKLIYRHPHVFGDMEVAGTEQVKQNWEMLKKKETGRESVLDGVPKQLPALQRANRIQEKAAKVGFDWKETDGVLAKVSEEIEEFKAESDLINREKEFGDILFSLVNFARHTNIDPERALRTSCEKFERRFKSMEIHLLTINKNMQLLPLNELESLWELVKSKEKN